MWRPGLRLWKKREQGTELTNVMVSQEVFKNIGLFNRFDGG